MIITTTPFIEGRPILEYKGIVAGETIYGANAIRDVFASIRDFFGGRSGSYEEVLTKARYAALLELETRATALGANAIVGVSFEYNAVGASGSMLMVVATGTAVTI